MEDTLVASAPSVDAELIQKDEEKKALEAAIRLLASGKLTDVQKRRFYLHFFQGLSTRQIAKLEGVHQRAVWDSLMWAEKKLKKIPPVRLGYDIIKQLYGLCKYFLDYKSSCQRA